MAAPRRMQGTSPARFSTRLCAAALLALVLAACTATTGRVPAQSTPPPGVARPPGTDMPAPTRSEVTSTARPPTPPAAIQPTSTSTPWADCPIIPNGGFFDVWQTPKYGPRLGCALEKAYLITGTDVYWCCQVHSMWLEQKEAFVVLRIDQSWELIPDGSGLPAHARLVDPREELYATAAPEPTLEAGAPTPLPTVLLMARQPWRPELGTWPPCYEPSGRHAWLATEPRWSSSCNRLAGSNEEPIEGSMQRFEGGWLLWNGYQCFVLWNDGRYILCGGNSKS